MTWLVSIPDAVALVVCAIAAAIDLRTRRIPNRLTFPAIGGGLALCAAIGLGVGGPLGGVWWLLSALGGATIGLVVFGVPAALGLVGMGDVKLAIALGALLRWPLALPLMLYVAIAGGALAIAYAVRRGRARTVARNVLQLGSTSQAALHRMPYGLAIAIGCAWAIASRHVPSLRLL